MKEYRYTVKLNDKPKLTTYLIMTAVTEAEKLAETYKNVSIEVSREHS